MKERSQQKTKYSRDAQTASINTYCSQALTESEVLMGVEVRAKHAEEKLLRSYKRAPTLPRHATRLSPLLMHKIATTWVVLNACHKINISTSIKKHLGQIARRTTQHRQGKLERHTGGRKQTSLKKTRTLRMHTLRLQVSLGK